MNKTLIALSTLLLAMSCTQVQGAEESTFDRYLTSKEIVDRHLEEARRNRMEYEQRQQTYELRRQTQELRKIRENQDRRNVR